MTAALAEFTTVGIRLVDIRTDGGTQTRAALSEPAIERYQLVAKLLPPVHVFYDGESYWLADGFHRREAWERAGMDFVSAIVHQGSARAAVLYACGANDNHGVQRSHADARRAVERLLRDEEWRKKSDRWIGDQCKVSPTTVGRVRAELGAHTDVREVTRGGSTYEMATPRPSPEPPASVHGGQIDRDTFQAPEPDNTVRTPVQHEHKGAPLTEELREAIVQLMDAGWSRAHVAQRFRVAPMEVDAVVAAARAARAAAIGEVPESINGTSDEPSSDVEKQEETDGPLNFSDENGAPLNSNNPPLRFAAPCKDNEDRRTDRDLKLSQWWTPPDLAAYMVEWAGIEAGAHVLEPAAGTGRLVEALLAAGATVEAHEIDPFWIPQLRARGGEDVLEVFEGDYLNAEHARPENGRWAYPWGCTNPPYENGLDGQFIARLLAECEQVVALVRVNIFLSAGRYRDLWSVYKNRLAKVEFIVSRPDFADGEEGFDGALSDFVLLHFDGEERADGGAFGWVVDRFGGEA